MSNKILKLGLLLFITVVVIVCAGCTSKTSSDVAANTSSDVAANTSSDVAANTSSDVAANTSSDVAANTSSDVAANTRQDGGQNLQQQDSNAKNSKVETSSETENSFANADESQTSLFPSEGRIAEQNTLKKLEPSINQEFLNKTPLHISNLSDSSVRRTPGDTVRVVRTDVNDYRGFEGSDDWNIALLLENTGNRPAYVFTELRDPLNYNDFYLPDQYTLMDSGDRMQLDKWSGVEMNDSIVEIDYCPTERPAISPEFSSLKEITLKRGYLWTKEPSPFIDVKSVTYKETNTEKKWGSMVIECKGTENQKGNFVGFATNNAVPGNYSFTLEGDKYISVEIPLDGEDPAKQTTNINIYSYSLEK